MSWWGMVIKCEILGLERPPLKKSYPTMHHDLDHDDGNMAAHFRVLHETAVLGARRGTLSLAGRSISTPHYLALTSRGAVPHISHDNLREHCAVRGVYLGLEDCISTSTSLYSENLTKNIVQFLIAHEINPPPCTRSRANPASQASAASPPSTTTRCSSWDRDASRRFQIRQQTLTMRFPS